MAQTNKYNQGQFEKKIGLTAVQLSFQVCPLSMHQLNKNRNQHTHTQPQQKKTERRIKEKRNTHTQSQQPFQGRLKQEWQVCWHVYKATWDTSHPHLCSTHNNNKRQKKERKKKNPHSQQQTVSREARTRMAHSLWCPQGNLRHQSPPSLQQTTKTKSKPADKSGSLRSNSPTGTTEPYLWWLGRTGICLDGDVRELLPLPPDVLTPDEVWLSVPRLCTLSRMEFSTVSTSPKYGRRAGSPSQQFCISCQHASVNEGRRSGRKPEMQSNNRYKKN